MKKATKRRRSRKSVGSRLMVIAAVIVLAMVLAIVFHDPGDEVDVTREGIVYLEMLEQRGSDEVARILRQRHQAELAAQREEMLQQLRDGELSPFGFFQDAVIMGDSRAVGFWYYGFVDEARTLTGHGHTVLDITNQLDTLEAMNPQYIYLCYGLNDLKIGFWGSSDRFVSEYMEAVEKIRERLPDAVIVVNSLLPVTEKVYQNATEKLEDPQYTADLTLEEKLELKGLQRTREIPEWNAKLAQACSEHNVIFADNTAVSEAYMNLWESDGIHMKQTFYPHWAKVMVLAALEEGGTQVEEYDI